MTESNGQEDFLKEKEIQRLINSNGKKEPAKGVLSEEEILKYAKDSKTAALIRLKNGSDDFHDKLRVHKENVEILVFFVLIPDLICLFFSLLGNVYSAILFLIFLLILINYPLYHFYIKDYSEDKFAFQNQNERKNLSDNNHLSVENNDIESFNVYKSQIRDLKKVYEIKEKTAKELIKMRFEPPQLTYDKFITSVDNCTELFNNQSDVALNIINLATEHSSELDYEIETRINILKSIIGKIDSLSNSLVLNIGQSQSKENEYINNLLEDMENLTKSVNEYK